MSRAVSVDRVKASQGWLDLVHMIDDAHEMRCDGSPNPPRTNPIKWMLKIKNPWKILYCTVTPYAQCDNVPSRTDEKQPVFVKPTPLERQTKSVERWCC